MSLLYFVVSFLSAEGAEDIFKIIDATTSESEINTSSSSFPATELTYNNYILLLDCLVNKQLNVQKYLPEILSKIDDIYLPNKISNLTRKIRNYLKNGGDGNAVIKEIYKDPCYDLPAIFTKYGITLEQLILKNMAPLDHPVPLTHSDILYLRRVLHYRNLPWTVAEYWVTALLNTCQTTYASTPTANEIRPQWNNLHQKFKILKQSGSESASTNLTVFLNENYKLPSKQMPKTKKAQNVEDYTNTLEQEIEAQQVDMIKLRKELVQNYANIIDLNEQINNLVLENVEHEQKTRDYEKLQQEMKKKCSIIDNLKEKIASLNVRNVNKKLNRRDTKINELSNAKNTMSERLNFFLRENDTLENELEELNNRVRNIHSQWYKDKKMKSYYKVRLANQEPQKKELTDKLKKSDTTIKELEKQVSDLELANVQEKTEHHSIETFSAGKYKDEVRHVYMDLISMGVSINKCKEVIESVLSNLANIEVDRLPKKSLASIIGIEAHIISQAQAAECILKNEGNCLHLDGTKKRFTEYAGFQVSTKEGNFSLSHQIMPSGDAKSYMKATNETFVELAEAINDGGDATVQNQTVAKIKQGIAGLMTDRHIVNKSYKKLFEKEKMDAFEILHGQNKTEEEKISASSVTGLFCGLHVLPNMATAAVKGMKAFEKENNVVKNSIFEGNSAGNELIYEVTKSFIEMSGCQKSGDALDFNEYLAQINEKNHLVTFLHNRFNILFVDGAAVFYHRNHISEYLSSGRSSKNNKLLASVQQWISNRVLLAECRALGILSKLVTGPLWRLLENPEISFFRMNDFWQVLVNKIDEYSENSEVLLTGEPIFALSPIDKDLIFNCLFNPSDLDELTKSALEHICSAIKPVLDRQLSDQLLGGSLYIPNDKIDPNLVMPKTNRISEADFSALDRIDKTAPQKSRSGKSGIITFTVNKTSKFLSKLSNQTKKRYFTIARKTALRRLLRDKQKKKTISIELQNLQNTRMQKKRQRAERLERSKNNLQEQMNKEGVWVNVNETDHSLQGKTKAKQRLLIRNQILFHSKILNSKFPSKSLVKFQDKNVKFNNETLLENLKIIITSNFVDGVPEPIIRINSNVIADNAKVSRKRKQKPQEIVDAPLPKVPKVSFQVDKYYAIAYTDGWYPGRCVQVLDKNSAQLDFLIPSGKFFKWPNKNDIQVVVSDGALAEIDILPVSNGRLWAVVEKTKIDQLFKK